MKPSAFDIHGPAADDERRSYDAPSTSSNGNGNGNGIDTSTIDLIRAANEQRKKEQQQNAALANAAIYGAAGYYLGRNPLILAAVGAVVAILARERGSNLLTTAAGWASAPGDLVASGIARSGAANV